MRTGEILKVKTAAKKARESLKSETIENTLDLIKNHMQKQEQSRVNNDRRLRVATYFGIVVYILMAVYFLNLILQATGLLHTHF